MHHLRQLATGAAPDYAAGHHQLPTQAYVCDEYLRASRDIFLYAFDVLELNGQDVWREPWEARRNALAKLISKGERGMSLSEHIDDADGDLVFRHACALRLESIVGKRRDRPYRSGRSADWIKIKNPAAPAATS